MYVNLSPLLAIILWAIPCQLIEIPSDSALTHSDQSIVTSLPPHFGNIADKNDESHVEKFTRFAEVTTDVSKPSKKKPYGSITKPPSSIDQQQLDHRFDSHSENFDFNLDDLEDIHENFKKGDLSHEETLLLRDSNSNASISSEPLTDTPIDSIKSSANGTSNGNRHIYKVTKPIKAKTKSRELLKKDDLQKTIGNVQNSVAREFLDISNSTSLNVDQQNDFLHVFQAIVNLYDHFFWQPSLIRTKVSPACGVELLSYLSALSNSDDWALRAYDSSGRYRGQILYGNDLWIGEKMFCDEVNFLNERSERKHFRFGFYSAQIILRNLPIATIPKILQVGECLPMSCSAKDVEAILELDPHARILQTQNFTIERPTLPTPAPPVAPLPLQASSPLAIPATNMTKQLRNVQVVQVRRVPGDYIPWNDSKFQAFCGICTALAVIIVVATIYEHYLNGNSNSDGTDFKKTNRMGLSSTPASAAATAKVNAKLEKSKTSTDNANGKAFELFQINARDNNNIDLEAEVNGSNKGKKPSQQPKGSPAVTVSNGKGDAGDGGCLTSKKSLGFWKQLLLCFALGSNGSAILSVEKGRETFLACIHGIRTLSLFWTIMVHTYLQLYTIGENKYSRRVTERSFAYQLIGNATFSVDSFFYLSGLLMTHLYLKHEKPRTDNRNTFIRRGCSQSFLMIIYRYIRLTPSYIFVVFFAQLSLQYTFNQSVFYPTVSAHHTCAEYWWRNILYINNWYPFHEMCLLWSWYLANDMQFHIMATILLVISTRYFKASTITLFAFLLTSWATSGIFSLHFGYTHKVSDPFESFDFLYDKPWQRVGTYIVGMITGYILHRVRTPPRIPFTVNLLLWIASVGLLFLLVFGVWDGQLGVLRTAFYVSLGHTAWGLGLVWIVLSCAWGLAPPINKFLSYRGFLPLSRLTYCTYLIHPVTMLITSFKMEGPIHLEHSMVLTVFLGNAVLSFLVAFAISVSFEAPVIRLLKILFPK